MVLAKAIPKDEDACAKIVEFAQDLIENTKFLENISLKSQIRQKFNRFKEEFHKDFSKFANEEYLTKVKNVVDNNIGLKLENFFRRMLKWHTK
jgi:hypothetical protein